MNNKTPHNPYQAIRPQNADTHSYPSLDRRLLQLYAGGALLLISAAAFLESFRSYAVVLLIIGVVFLGGQVIRAVRAYHCDAVGLVVDRIFLPSRITTYAEISSIVVTERQVGRFSAFIYTEGRRPFCEINLAQVEGAEVLIKTLAHRAELNFLDGDERGRAAFAK